MHISPPKPPFRTTWWYLQRSIVTEVVKSDIASQPLLYCTFFIINFTTLIVFLIYDVTYDVTYVLALWVDFWSIGLHRSKSICYCRTGWERVKKHKILWAFKRQKGCCPLYGFENEGRFHANGEIVDMGDFVSGIAQGQKFMHYVFSDDLQGRGKPSIGEIGEWRFSCQDLVLAT